MQKKSFILKICWEISTKIDFILLFFLSLYLYFLLKIYIMKNYFVIIFVACSTFVCGQSLKVFYDGEQVADTIEIAVNPTVETKCYIDITNISMDTVSIMWAAELSLIPNAIVSFCAFGECADMNNGHNGGPQDAYYVQPGETIDKNHSSGGIYLTYIPNEAVGTSYMEFTFSNEEDPSDKVSFVFKFVSSVTRICNPNRQTVNLFRTYPNPASSTIYIQYELHDKTTQEVQLVLHSLTGSVIKTIPVNAFENTIKIDVKDMAQGIYFCSLKINGVISSSRKIIITK